jgi:hypothetical protein
VAYLGSRVYGDDGGNFLIAGPSWSGQTPPGIRDVIRFETEFAYLLFRTQLFNPGDLGRVKEIQKGYKAQALSAFLGKPAPAAAPTVAWLPPAEDMLASPALFNYLNLMLQFCPTDPTEIDLMAQFAMLNIGAGKNFEFGKLPAELQQAVVAGLGDVKQDVEAEMQRVNSGEVGSSDVFGTRQFLKNNYLYRFMAAKQSRRKSLSSFTSPPEQLTPRTIRLATGGRNSRECSMPAGTSCARRPISGSSNWESSRRTRS